ncbi:SMP-30/gluconolactonase/LRE family protein [Siculibacillus lacustris]|uniref:SMP-30/gluconolactonase/LRE family protein n=1 Tax=Siculibacillus lacustris TaxID=1549641 RepID=A0A4V2KUG3_9HYPH|nr:SMP-30/gluconolactonase/LRE family protein [Siculibacillus lacustris]TBW41405.1 SMP-30/gluconolactonase/LRE family protein [Siculibacillus lacustris]
MTDQNVPNGTEAFSPSRRALITGAATLAAVAATSGSAVAGWEPSTRIPDPAVKILDDAFKKYWVSSATVERIATGCRWAEGPVWMGDWRCLLWSDVTGNAMMRWDEVTGEVSAYRSPSNFSNGNARDFQGRLITCEHLYRRVTRTEIDGSITVIADKFEGKPLNSPNDIVSRSDGSVWFTDPAFGPNPSERMSKPELPGTVYRIAPDGKITAMATDIKGPNGLCFSPDEKILYVIESRTVPRQIRAYDVVDNGTRIANSRILLVAEAGATPDGFRCDADGNLWCGWGQGSDAFDGVRVFSPEGKAIAHITLPERCANLTFGGANHDRLFMASSHSIYSLMTNARGATAW